MELKKHLYELAGSRGQACIDRFRYAVGILPRVHQRPGEQATTQGYPAPFKACLVISADLELAWAWRYMKHVPDPLSYAIQRAEQARRNFPELLALFDRYETPVTWAVLGHLFLESCARDNDGAHPEVRRIPYFENEFWQFLEGDWFDADSCSDYQRDPAWYAPDLIHAILKAKVKHEIACHSFSHIDFSDGVCPPEVADSELRKCQEIAREWGLELKSFAFPANLVGNRASLKRYGFAAYRWHSGYELDVPCRDDLGLWQIPCGVCWEKPARWAVDAWVGALRRCVDRALETGTVLHLWFHPSCDPINVETVFPALLDYVAARRSDLCVMTMGGLVDRLTAVGESEV